MDTITKKFPSRITNLLNSKSINKHLNTDGQMDVAFGRNCLVNDVCFRRIRSVLYAGEVLKSKKHGKTLSYIYYCLKPINIHIKYDALLKELSKMFGGVFKLRYYKLKHANQDFYLIEILEKEQLLAIRYTAQFIMFALLRGIDAEVSFTWHKVTIDYTTWFEVLCHYFSVNQNGHGINDDIYFMLHSYMERDTRELCRILVRRFLEVITYVYGTYREYTSKNLPALSINDSDSSYGFDNYASQTPCYRFAERLFYKLKVEERKVE